MQLEIIGFILLLIVLQIILTPFIKNKSILACGLAAFSGPDNFDMMKIKFLLYWNSIERGTDATGIFTPKTEIVKDNTRAEYFINNKNYIGKVKDDNVLIGHVRAKTFGANTPANSHPFEYNGLILAHNGTLKNHYSLGHEYGLKMADYDVDSQVLASCMSLDFIKGESKFDILNKYDGAAALLFYDKGEEVLYACHDKERPLFYGYIGENMYISSIKDSLEAIDCTDTKAFPINIVHKIKDGKIVDTIPYTPYVAPALTARIAGFNDIRYVNYKGNMVLELAPDIKGIAYAQAKASMLVGYYLRIDNHQANRWGKFKFDEWYYCDSVEKEQGSVDKLVLIDDEDMPCIVPITSVDTTAFIPTKGAYIITNYNLVNNKKVVLAHRNDVCTVLKYEYGDIKIEIKNLTNNRTITCDVAAIRLMSPNEVTAYKKEQKAIEDLNKAVEKEDKGMINVNALLEAMRIEEEEEAKNLNPEPLTSPFEEDDMDIPDEEEEEEEDLPEDYIPHSMHCDFVDELRARVTAIEKHVNVYQIPAASEALDELHEILLKAHDLNYVEEFIQE